MKNSELMINQIIEKINEASKQNMALNLSAEEVKILSEEIGDMVLIPVLSWDDLAKLPKKPVSKKNEE